MTVGAASYDNQAETLTDGRRFVARWLAQIDQVRKSDADWREDARRASDIYGARTDGKVPFNILYSNTVTTLAAIYSSQPQPDVRRRWRDDDPVAAQAAQMLERALSWHVDVYDFDAFVRSVCVDALIAGRGVPRVRYLPARGVATCERIPWHDLVIGPAYSWDQVPWIAIRHDLTREQLVALNPEVGPAMGIGDNGAGQGETEDAERPEDVWKRAEVWEIWDRETQRVIFIARGHTAEPLKIEVDLLRLQGFFPIPRPLEFIERSDAGAPITPYSMYKGQAEELNEITRRIKRLVAALRWRGYRSGNIPDFDKLTNGDDGDMAPVEDWAAVMQAGGFDSMIWFAPIERLVEVLRELQSQREAVKQTIYEVIGLSDVMRGASKASETASAQNIKAQWGGMRISIMQGEVARMVRDLFRMKAEILAEQLDEQRWLDMTGIIPAPETMQMLRDDRARGFRVDIETDSTIRGNMQAAQEAFNGFGAAVGAIGGALLPLVQMGVMPVQVMGEMLKGVARTFKLGRQVEDALDLIGQPPPAPMPPQGGPVDPATGMPIDPGMLPPGMEGQPVPPMGVGQQPMMAQ